jgi:hypothetical protein
MVRASSVLPVPVSPTRIIFDFSISVSSASIACLETVCNDYKQKQKVFFGLILTNNVLIKKLFNLLWF